MIGAVQALPSSRQIPNQDSLYAAKSRYGPGDRGDFPRLTPPRAPQANSYCERVIRTLRRECLHDVIVVGERHAERVLHTPHGIVAAYRREGWHTTGPSSSLACNLQVIQQQRGARIRAANQIAIKEWLDAATSASPVVVSNNETHSGAAKNNCLGVVGCCDGVLLPSQAGHTFKLRPARDAGRPGQIGSASL